MPSPADKANDASALEVIRASRHFGAVRGLDDVTVTAARGEFLTILGQSGSGKTTLLRIIAGLDHPTSVAALRIGGKDVLGLPPHKRNVTTVFQHYGLFPHMSVGQNVEYGLKLRGVGASERRTRAEAALGTVRLTDKYDRRIHQLSGGERQRVALARSILTEPDVLLLDEPLGALDERLRLDMQIELVELQRRLGMTFVFITHSQEEALTMSDRVILMRGGRIAQEGTPRDLFERPCSRFAGSFMGVENIIDGTVADFADGIAGIATPAGIFHGLWTGVEPPRVGQAAALLLRAEKLRIGTTAFADSFEGRITARIYKGKYIDVAMETRVGVIHARAWTDEDLTSDTVRIGWSAGDARCVPAEG